MDNRAIGIFDSGLGGLTAVAALRELMPRENIVYFADSGRLPYGARSREELMEMTRQDMDFLSSFSTKLMIAACGTVSTNADSVLRSGPCPCIGVLEPGAEALARVPGDAPLGVAATAASINSGAYLEAVRRRCPGREIIPMPCPDFVPLIESGHTAPDDEDVKEAVERSLAPAREAGVAALLLGCTHYGIISQAIRNCLGPEITLISASESAARAACSSLLRQELTGGCGKTEYYTSGPAEEFSAAASRLLGREVHAEHVPVMEMPRGRRMTET